MREKTGIERTEVVLQINSINMAKFNAYAASVGVSPGNLIDAFIENTVNVAGGE